MIDARKPFSAPPSVALLAVAVVSFFAACQAALPRGEALFSAPFGRTSEHPMHIDKDEETKAEVRRLWEKARPK